MSFSQANDARRSTIWYMLSPGRRSACTGARRRSYPVGTTLSGTADQNSHWASRNRAIGAQPAAADVSRTMTSRALTLQAGHSVKLKPRDGCDWKKPFGLPLAAKLATYWRSVVARPTSSAPKMKFRGLPSPGAFPPSSTLNQNGMSLPCDAPTAASGFWAKSDGWRNTNSANTQWAPTCELQTHTLCRLRLRTPRRLRYAGMPSPLKSRAEARAGQNISASASKWRAAQ